MTRREFLAQAAATSVAAAMMGTKNVAFARPSTSVLDAESKRRADLEMFLKIFPLVVLP